MSGTNIQVDMFEVQLGAAMLLQFRPPEGGVVRVLVDAGVDKRSGYPINHVHDKLFQNGSPTEVWSSFSDVEPKLDLIVGTHYDADHLRGLVPIILNTDLVIAEIWLPPVQDDNEVISTSTASGGDSSLVKRLMAEDGEAVLRGYLAKRVSRIEEVNRAYVSLGEGRELGTRDGVSSRRDFDHVQKSEHVDLTDLDAALAFFERQQAFAIERLGTQNHHAQELQDESDENFAAAVHMLKSHPFSWRYGVGYWEEFGNYGAAPLALEAVRKSAASEAITASNLAAVIVAIKERHKAGGNKIRVLSEGISAGQPRYFRWVGARFREAAPQSHAGLGFHLMGPSHELIAKLHEKLPIGSYLLAYRVEDLRSGTVTPSNRLSYVMRFHLEDQRILITGDAGFSDFAPERTSNFYVELLNLLRPLHVLQVAHHGGANHRFYQALAAANLPGQDDWSFLLLSHETDDEKRPRPEFGRFVSLFRRDQRHDVSVLFTSRPQLDKVEPFIDVIHPLKPLGTPSADEGDVRLSFPHTEDSERGGTRWMVEKHSIQV